MSLRSVVGKIVKLFWRIRVSEQWELADGYSKAQELRAVPNAVEYRGVGLLYGFGQALYARFPICRIRIFILRECA